MQKPKNKFLSTRVTADEHKAFGRKAQKHGQPSEILRELVKAFIDDRMTIKPPVNSKEGLFNHE